MPKPTHSQVFLSAASGHVDDLKTLCEVKTELAEYPLAHSTEQRVLIYDNAAFQNADTRPLMEEINRALDIGPGVIVIKGGIPDLAALEAATAVFEQLIEDERGTGGGDHFAKPGANDRVWNAAQKHCLADPANFARYFSFPAVDLPCRAWLGEGYQLTAQVNRVNPGGAAQTPHRDYHLGFMDAARVATYPSQVHALSPLLTLQGAIAHVDMPLETGPTMILPYSQKFHEGYVAFGREEFQAYFQETHSQLPLDKGDVMFFNPAVMHGAGTNRTSDKFRMGNLLQVGSAFGRSIETVNRETMCRALYPVLSTSDLSDDAISRIVAATAEGYAFPTNLDLDPPVGGLIPESQAEMMKRALKEGIPERNFLDMLTAQTARKMA